MPSATVPERIVRFSTPGCQWGGTLYPAGTCARTTNGCACVGSPWTTAIFAPGGRLGGASPHFNSPGASITCGPEPLAGAASELKMSSATFHAPSTFFQVVTY